jgi:hypothetical protein
VTVGSQRVQRRERVRRCVGGARLRDRTARGFVATQKQTAALPAVTRPCGGAPSRCAPCRRHAASGTQGVRCVSVAAAQQACACCQLRAKRTAAAHVAAVCAFTLRELPSAYAPVAALATSSAASSGSASLRVNAISTDARQQNGASWREGRTRMGTTRTVKNLPPPRAVLPPWSRCRARSWSG